MLASPAAGLSSKLLPFVDGGDRDGRLVAGGEFVVAGGDCPVALGAIDAAFHGVPPCLGWGAERGWSSHPGTAEPVIRLLDIDSTGFVLLPGPYFTGPSRVLTPFGRSWNPRSRPR